MRPRRRRYRPSRCSHRRAFQQRCLRARGVLGQQCPCACIVRRKASARRALCCASLWRPRRGGLARESRGRERDPAGPRLPVARADRFRILSACERDERQHVRRVRMPDRPPPPRVPRARAAGKSDATASSACGSARADRISPLSRDPPVRARRGIPCTGGRFRTGTEHCAMPGPSSSLHLSSARDRIDRRLEVPRKPRHVEQRLGLPIGDEAFAKLREAPRVARERERARLVFGEAVGDELRQSDCMELASRGAARHRLAHAGEHRDTRQQRIVRRRSGAVRRRVEKQIGVGVAREMLR